MDLYFFIAPYTPGDLANAAMARLNRETAALCIAGKKVTTTDAASLSARDWEQFAPTMAKFHKPAGLVIIGKSSSLSTQRACDALTAIVNLHPQILTLALPVDRGAKPLPLLRAGFDHIVSPDAENQTLAQIIHNEIKRLDRLRKAWGTDKRKVKAAEKTLDSKFGAHMQFHYYGQLLTLNPKQKLILSLLVAADGESVNLVEATKKTVPLSATEINSLVGKVNTALKALTPAGQNYRQTRLMPSVYKGEHLLLDHGHTIRMTTRVPAPTPPLQPAARAKRPREAKP